MTEEENIFPNGGGGIDNRLGRFDGMIPAHEGIFYADTPASGGADMRDDRVSACLGHFDGLFWCPDVDDRKKIHAPSERDHFVFFFHGHAGFFEDVAEMAIDDRVRGEIIYPGEAHFFYLA